MTTICHTTIGDRKKGWQFQESSFLHEISIRSTVFDPENPDEAAPMIAGQKSFIYLTLFRVENENSLTFGKNEYISQVKYACNIFPTYLRFTTNLGRYIEAGDLSDSGDIKTLENIRLLGIQFANNQLSSVGYLHLTYLGNYQPSACVASNQNFIISFTPQFEEPKEIADPFEENLNSYKIITAHMMNRTLNLAVEAEFFLKVSMTLEVNPANPPYLNNTPFVNNPQYMNGPVCYRLTTLQKKLENLKSGNQSQHGAVQYNPYGVNQQSLRKTAKVPEGHVSIKVVNGDLMKGQDGIFWMFPTSVASDCILKVGEVENILGHYDLTGQLHDQMLKLKNYKTTKNGYVYYAERNLNLSSIN